MKSLAILELGETLLENQKMINQLQEENTAIKKILVKHLVVDQELDFGDGKIECRQHADSLSFVPRKEVLNYIRLKYGKDIARDVDNRCTKITKAKKTLYIKARKTR
ncbi:hypothetical protein [Methylomonas sp. TEB]|uniref:hypothetical protein n=1 Tax=Methylomonas sp. TEB TaxID=3398229 RepID=UPI0039F48325